MYASVLRTLAWCQLIAGLVIAGGFLLSFPLQAVGQLAEHCGGPAATIACAILSSAIIAFVALSISGRLAKSTLIPSIALFSLWWALPQLWLGHVVEGETILETVGYLLVGVIFAALGVGLVILSRLGPRCCG